MKAIMQSINSILLIYCHKNIAQEEVNIFENLDSSISSNLIKCMYLKKLNIVVESDNG